MVFFCLPCCNLTFVWIEKFLYLKLVLIQIGSSIKSNQCKGCALFTMVQWCFLHILDSINFLDNYKLLNFLKLILLKLCGQDLKIACRTMIHQTPRIYVHTSTVVYKTVKTIKYKVLLYTHIF